MKRSGPIPRRTPPKRSGPPRSNGVSALAKGFAPENRNRKGWMKKKRVQRDWTDANEKFLLEPFCRYCGTTEHLERAHTVGRTHDAPHPNGAGLWVNPDDIVPLCGAMANGCHPRYDAHELDILAVLHPHEQARAVLVAGGLVSAMRRLTGSKGEIT